LLGAAQRDGSQSRLGSVNEVCVCSSTVARLPAASLQAFSVEHLWEARMGTVERNLSP